VREILNIRLKIIKEDLFRGLYSIFKILNISRWYFKGTPVICYILMGIVFLNMYGAWNHRSRMFSMVGIVFALGGDYTLMLDWSGAFLTGMGLFLFTHIFYITALSVSPTKDDPNVPSHLLRLFLCVCIFGPLVILVIILMVRSSTSLLYLISISIYSCIELITIWRALSRVMYTPKSYHELLLGQIMVLVGIILFAISDALLAIYALVPINRDGRDLIVLIPYWLGQGLFMMGIMLGGQKEANGEKTKLIDQN